MVCFLVPQTLLIAVAFGTADYATGRPGGPAGVLFTGISALLVALACAAGARAAARELRRAELSQADCLRAALGPPIMMAVAIAGNGLLTGAGPGGCALVLMLALPASAISARIGARGGR